LKVKRIFELLRDIEKGRLICVKDIAKKLGIDSRTIQRYLNDIEKIFEVKRVLIRKGCYKFPTFKKLEFVDKDFEKIATIFSAFDKRIVKYFGVNKEILNKVVESDFLYVKHSPVEELMKVDLIKMQICN